MSRSSASLICLVLLAIACNFGDDGAPSRNTSARSYVALKDAVKAAEASGRELSLRGDYAEARFNLALAHCQSGRKGEVRAEQGKLRRSNSAQAARFDELFK